jgi:hypothetical protein
MLEKELKVLGVAERAVKRITCTLQCASSAWLSGFLFLPVLGGYGGKPRQTSLRMKKTRRSYVFKMGTVPCCAGPCPCRRQNPGWLFWLRLFPALVASRDFAFYLAFGHAGLCRGRNPG